MLSNRTPNTYIKNSSVALIRVMNQSNTCAHQKPIKSGLGWAETVPTKSQSKADLKTNENPCQVHQKRTPQETKNKSPPNAKAHTRKRPSKACPTPTKNTHTSNSPPKRQPKGPRTKTKTRERHPKNQCISARMRVEIIPKN